MRDQILIEVHINYNVDKANEQLNEILNEYREKGYFVKHFSNESTERLFILFEKSILKEV